MIRVFYFCLRVGLEGNKVWSFLVVFIKPLSLWDWGHKMRGCWESWLQLYYRERKFFRQPKSSSFFTRWYLPGNLLRCSVPTHSTLLFYFYCTTCALLLFVLWSSCGLGDSAPVLVDDVKRKWQSPLLVGFTWKLTSWAPPRLSSPLLFESSGVAADGVFVISRWRPNISFDA
jgi:hypothetical protein